MTKAKNSVKSKKAKIGKKTSRNDNKKSSFKGRRTVNKNSKRNSSKRNSRKNNRRQTKKSNRSFDSASNTTDEMRSLLEEDVSENFKGNKSFLPQNYETPNNRANLRNFLAPGFQPQSVNRNTQEIDPLHVQSHAPVVGMNSMGSLPNTLYNNNSTLSPLGGNLNSTVMSGNDPMMGQMPMGQMPMGQMPMNQISMGHLSENPMSPINQLPENQAIENQAPVTNNNLGSGLKSFAQMATSNILV